MPDSLPFPPSHARAIWLHAQGLDRDAPFGSGPETVRLAIEHLGYVQIDTINVIERCHHHILYSRIPGYRRAHLDAAQAIEKSVFEYWTHALAYVPVRDFSFHLARMRAHKAEPNGWFSSIDPADVRKVLKRIRTEGPLSIRDIDDDVLVEKDHPWASRKPSKRALQLAFFNGDLTVSARSGMLKTYELTGRHFGWERPPRPATENQFNAYLLERALRAQGLVSLESICHLSPKRKPAIRALIEARVKRKELVAVHLEGHEKQQHWMRPEWLEERFEPPGSRVHILSPFDPLIIQRRRLELFFGYQHLFEAYVPKEKRVLGYFALPVLVGDRVVAAIDMKADRQSRSLLIQKWNRLQPEGAEERRAIEEALHAFEHFQFAGLSKPVAEEEG